MPVPMTPIMVVYFSIIIFMFKGPHHCEPSNITNLYY